MNALPLVLVHGYMGGAMQWSLQRDSLGSLYRIITVDLPGFSSNAHLDAPNTISGFAEYVLGELSVLKIDRFNLLGHSMGGMIVQEMMAIAPERVERLILYGTAASGNLDGRFETFETSRQRALNDGVTRTARRISATWFKDNELAIEFENCARIAEQSSHQALLAALEAMEAWCRKENLANISCPTLIIWGEADRTYRWPQINELWTTVPEASLAVLPDCAHAAHLEKPEIFNAMLRDFLK